jgi:hypothetical protein
MLKYMPLIGSILLTVLIAWVGISTWVANRRRIRSALAGHSYCVIPNGQSIMPEARKSLCCGAATFRPRWTADGWVAPCQCCGEWQYLGDDYEHPPQDAIIGTEVTSAFYEEMRLGQARHFDRLARDFSEDEGEPLPASMSHAPNIGGEGNPDYAGPHYAAPVDYELPENRFVPYDVLRDPPDGAAVHFVGNAACVGPLSDESQRDEGHAGSAANDHRSD